MLAFGSATGHCPCSYLYVGHWKCLLVTIYVTTLYVEPIVTYYSCKILILSILLVIKDWGCNTETVISIYLFIFLGKYYALSCFIIVKEWSKENCDKKPIYSYSCKYLYSTHFTTNKLKSWVPHTYYYIFSSKLNCCIFSCLSAFQRTQTVPKPCQAW